MEVNTNKPTAAVEVEVEIILLMVPAIGGLVVLTVAEVVSFRICNGQHRALNNPGLKDRIYNSAQQTPFSLLQQLRTLRKMIEEQLLMKKILSDHQKIYKQRIKEKTDTTMHPKRKQTKNKPHLPPNLALHSSRKLHLLVHPRRLQTCPVDREDLFNQLIHVRRLLLQLHRRTSSLIEEMIGNLQEVQQTVNIHHIMTEDIPTTDSSLRLVMTGVQNAHGLPHPRS
jgi:hypothetical protein